MTKEHARQILEDAKTHPPQTQHDIERLRKAIALLANSWGPPAED